MWLDGVDGRSGMARRFREIFTGIEADLGGDLTEAAMTVIAHRAAFQSWVEEPGSSGTVEYRFRHADGSWRWMEGRVRNLLDEPAIEGMAVNSRDVTRRKRRERDLERQNERLEEFTGVVSHDLRNPLAVIDGYTDLVRETGEEQYVDGIEDAVDRMNRLIDDLLRLARQGRTIEDPETVDLADAVTMAWRHVDTGDADLRLTLGEDLSAGYRGQIDCRV